MNNVFLVWSFVVCILSQLIFNQLTHSKHTSNFFFSPFLCYDYNIPFIRYDDNNKFSFIIMKFLFVIMNSNANFIRNNEKKYWYFLAKRLTTLYNSDMVYNFLPYKYIFTCQGECELKWIMAHLRLMTHESRFRWSIYTAGEMEASKLDYLCKKAHIGVEVDQPYWPKNV